MKDVNKLSDEELEHVSGGAKEEEPPREDSSNVAVEGVGSIPRRVWICPKCKYRNHGGAYMVCKNCGYKH